ncbi:tRNA threonylcarbamoyladenosine biosynthesis protein TsaB [Sphaerotilus hippei]|uniref:tRNA threonylcarbamoyladenosine biosynthesis protein TsaB n=1 Tax=Sphaerotilus hippei TaxID=744406 RepID=A0A318H019_9BURK|nr:tRNA (adenosine(37)-N6)-threonylcarbamoyltransferase complex dimerization subunit type 1 TsaB [Sphaerotilus hippei]PXW95874.1 tRNA threonylcarbamoyladenosine biosynthesis protein TsaB [Sphaerotilus hippei]
MPRLLALDASTSTIHLALVQGDQVLTQAVAGGAQSSALLLPAVQALLAQAGLTVRGLDAIGFGRGPGAFTGLRTACSITQGLALGAGLPVIPLDTLALVAESAVAQGAPHALWAALDARMGEIYAARCVRQPDGRWLQPVPVALWSPAALCEAMRHDPAPLAGNAGLVHPELLLPGAPPAWTGAQPDGAALAIAVRQAFAAGAAVDPALALPLYVRDKVAQTTAERLALRQATIEGAP